FRGPRRDGKVGPLDLFRGTTAGDAVGPYLSQFLLKPIPFTPIVIDQKIRTAVPGLDYLTAEDSWLAIQNGQLAGVNQFAKEPLYLRNGRDLGEYVHRDFSYQPYLSACLQALKWGTPVDGGNPYKHSRTQSAFATFGQPYLLGLLATVTQSALGACWYQKWRVHFRLRPEEYGGRIASQLARRLDLPIPTSLLASRALAETRAKGSALLPQAYPEASPIHPSYPSGHAAIAGACVTALKACLDESHVVPEPVEPAPDGRTLTRFNGPPLTIGGELDKLAANISIGRNFAGIHYRSDAAEGLLQGEEIAIRILAEMKLTGGEIFAGWSLRKFDGRRLEI
ncbi:MAG TPA: vanadium-dependent haloperoxidase, partial [Thermoanaerobaculia bacterium]|nr:vanadium-dependent haloperoxidase [Thermoanaerobaculia bacterium]